MTEITAHKIFEDTLKQCGFKEKQIDDTGCYHADHGELFALCQKFLTNVRDEQNIEYLRNIRDEENRNIRDEQNIEYLRRLPYRF